MLKKLVQHYKTSAAILGSLSVLALPPYYILPILVLSFTGLLFLLNRSKNFKQSFAIGYWFGFGYFAFGFSWIGNALLIDAATFGWLYPIALISSGAFFGLFAGFPCSFTVYFKDIKSKFAVFPALWVLSEWLRSFILTGFPWNLLGSCLAFHPVGIQLASIIGTYGLSWLVLIISCAPILALEKHDKKNILITLAIMLTGISTIGIYGIWRISQYDTTKKSDIEIRIVQPSIPQTMKWNKETLEKNLQDYIKLSQTKGYENKDFIIWGETASPFPLDIDTFHRQKVTEAIPPQGYLITGTLRYMIDKYGEAFPKNSILIIDKRGDIIGEYDKSHLVPFGEYIPMREYLPSFVRPIANSIANFLSGSGPSTIKIKNYPSIGSVICYEIIFPHEIVNQNQRPEWIINATNDGWYGNSAGPYQHLVATQLRAVEEGISIVRAANSGISAIITPLGKIQNKIGLNQRGILDDRLPLQLNLYTSYGKSGNKIPLILVIFNIILVIFLTNYKR